MTVMVYIYLGISYLWARVKLRCHFSCYAPFELSEFMYLVYKPICVVHEISLNKPWFFEIDFSTFTFISKFLTKKVLEHS